MASLRRLQSGLDGGSDEGGQVRGDGGSGQSGHAGRICVAMFGLGVAGRPVVVKGKKAGLQVGLGLGGDGRVVFIETFRLVMFSFLKILLIRR